MESQSDYAYHGEHLWVLELQEQEALVGISNYAKSRLGDIVFVDLPAIGTEIIQGTPFGVVESMKVVSDLIAPVSGHVIGVNTSLQEDVAPINGDPQGDGWIIRIKLANGCDVSSLMSGEQYGKHCGA